MRAPTAQGRLSGGPTGVSTATSVDLDAVVGTTLDGRRDILRVVGVYDSSRLVRETVLATLSDIACVQPQMRTYRTLNGAAAVAYSGSPWTMGSRPALSRQSKNLLPARFWRELYGTHEARHAEAAERITKEENAARIMEDPSRGEWVGGHPCDRASSYMCHRQRRCSRALDAL